MLAASLWCTRRVSLNQCWRWSLYSLDVTLKLNHYDRWALAWLCRCLLLLFVVSSVQSLGYASQPTVRHLKQTTRKRNITPKSFANLLGLTGGCLELFYSYVFCLWLSWTRQPAVNSLLLQQHEHHGDGVNETLAISYSRQYGRWVSSLTLLFYSL